MKVLWVSTSPIGPAARILGKPYSGSSGGWIQTEYEELDKDGISLTFLCTSPTVPMGQIHHKKAEEGEAYCVNLPKISYGIKPPKALVSCIQSVIEKVEPDVMQIWGTESCISYIAATCCPLVKKVVFMQGIIGIHSRYYGGYLTENDTRYMRNVSLIEKLKEAVKKHYFKAQIPYEKETLKSCGNVISDNEFSIAYFNSISPAIKTYCKVFLANHIFNDVSWTFDGCDKNSIFTVYGITPDKGLHQLLKALTIVKRDVPQVKLYVPGPYVIDGQGRLKDNGLRPFEQWMKNYIHENGLMDNVCFTGKLNTKQMSEKYVTCNLFVNPSCMENHASTLREAMTVGTPSVTSFCGSVMEYVEHGKNGLIYRYEEYEVLAYYIVKILRNGKLTEELSHNARKTMQNRRTDIRSQALKEIYLEIIGENNELSKEK